MVGVPTVRWDKSELVRCMSTATNSTSALGLARAPLVFWSPGTLFRRVSDHGRYGWTLGAMLLVTTLIGWATVQTGLIDRQVDRQTQGALAKLEREQTDLLSRIELADRMQDIRDTAEFTKLIRHGQELLLAPIALVFSLMLIAAILFAVVALVGNKADYPLLMAICVYAALVEVLRSALRLAAMLYYRTMSVDTSLGLLLPYSEQTKVPKAILTAIDPFYIWFWALVGLGLVATGQLSRRAAVITCTSFWLVVTGVRMAAMLSATGAQA